ncbi:ABC transporter ATP-binding protein [Paenibacillus lemnae]|uniref:ABC transporter ATP-binding protein n=1 Tax=Paenibacillus lemnae TaxID=1330551 RepID=A0A848M6K5_PAELE|nr:ABC transporter ATP-binding protein [Paenibacillus lemnae]NMO96256.1 ABC transporter ATP-binding protein [Paenibacillus lemnae]
MDVLVTLNQVSKRYGRHIALHDVNWRICRGECAAITGDNGAGKSTLLHILAGLAMPDKGTIIINNGEVSIGYVPEFFPGLKFTPREYLAHMGRIQGLSKQAASKRVEGLISMFQMEQSSNRLMNGFSKGMLQKVNLMQALLGMPDLLVLDEPLSGLDEHVQHEIAKLLTEIKQQGTSIVMSVHEHLLISAVADRLVVMKNGKIMRDGLTDLTYQRNPRARSRVVFHGISPEHCIHIEQMDGFIKWISQGAPKEADIARECSNEMLQYILDAGGSILSLQQLKGPELPVEHQCVSKSKKAVIG